MSCITSIMIWGIAIDESKEEIDNWLVEHDHKPTGYVDAFSNSIVMGGERGISGGLLLGGFNYLEVDEFETFLRSLDWDLCEVWLYTKRPDDDCYTPINISHRYMFKQLCPICGKPQVGIKLHYRSRARYCACEAQKEEKEEK